MNWNLIWVNIWYESRFAWNYYQWLNIKFVVFSNDSFCSTPWILTKHNFEQVKLSLVFGVDSTLKLQALSSMIEKSGWKSEFGMNMKMANIGQWLFGNKSKIVWQMLMSYVIKIFNCLINAKVLQPYSRALENFWVTDRKVQQEGVKWVPDPSQRKS